MAKKREIQKLARSSSNSLGPWEGVTTVEPCVIFSNDEHEDMLKASFSTRVDDKLSELGWPDAGHDLGPMEVEGPPADNISRRSTDAGDICERPSSVYMAIKYANILRHPSSFAEREQSGESDHIGRR